MKKVRWGIFIFWVCLTVFLCLQDGKTSGEFSSYFASLINIEENALRKFAHFFVHFMLAFLAYQAITVSAKKKSTAILSSILLSLLFAITDEYFQIIAIDRSAELRDVIINISGVLSGTIISIFIAEESSH